MRLEKRVIVPTAERFNRTLAEIAKVADEMERLEPADRSIQYEQFVESNFQNTEYFLGEPVEEIAESAEHLLSERDLLKHVQATLGFERIELESTHLNSAYEMSADELNTGLRLNFPHWMSS